MAGKQPPITGCIVFIARVLIVGLIAAMLFYALNHACAWSVGF